MLPPACLSVALVVEIVWVRRRVFSFDPFLSTQLSTSQVSRFNTTPKQQLTTMARTKQVSQLIIRYAC